MINFIIIALYSINSPIENNKKSFLLYINLLIQFLYFFLLSLMNLTS